MSCRALIGSGSPELDSSSSSERRHPLLLQRRHSLLLEWRLDGVGARDWIGCFLMHSQAFDERWRGFENNQSSVRRVLFLKASRVKRYRYATRVANELRRNGRSLRLGHAELVVRPARGLHRAGPSLERLRQHGEDRTGQDGTGQDRTAVRKLCDSM